MYCVLKALAFSGYPSAAISLAPGCSGHMHICSHAHTHSRTEKHRTERQTGRNTKGYRLLMITMTTPIPESFHSQRFLFSFQHPPQSSLCLFGLLHLTHTLLTSALFICFVFFGYHKQHVVFYLCAASLSVARLNHNCNTTTVLGAESSMKYSRAYSKPEHLLTT